MFCSMLFYPIFIPSLVLVSSAPFPCDTAHFSPFSSPSYSCFCSFVFLSSLFHFGSPPFPHCRQAHFLSPKESASFGLPLAEELTSVVYVTFPRTGSHETQAVLPGTGACRLSLQEVFVGTVPVFRWRMAPSLKASMDGVRFGQVGV
jgi:hypothetical protein